MTSHSPKSANIPFRNFLMEQCLQLRRWSLLIALILYCLFAILDVLRLPPEAYQITLTTRFCFVIFPLIVLNVIYWFRPPESILTYVWLMMVVYVGAGLNHSLIHYFSEIYQAKFSQLGLVLILMFGSLLTALPVLPSLISSLIILSVYAISNYFLGHSGVELTFGTIILFVVAGLCLGINQVCQAILLENYRLIKKFYGESITDGLTGLYNKRFFETQLEHLSLLARRDKKLISLLLIDLDYFKDINDRHGHIAGDRILQEVAKLLQSICRRPNDYACRIGGDEFAVILYGISSHRLINVCHELLENTAKITIDTNDGSKQLVSVSIGAATQDSYEDVEGTQLIERADKSLYRAKERGRKTFEVYN